MYSRPLVENYLHLCIRLLGGLALFSRNYLARLDAARFFLAFAAAFCVLVCLPRTAIAVDEPTEEQAEKQAAGPPWSESFFGGEIGENVWQLYSGATLSPFGGLDENGWRLRVAGGYGQYQYSGRPRLTPTAPLNTYTATFHHMEIMVGYQLRIGALTGKAFVGLAMLDHAVPDEIATDLVARGEAYGAKAALELWLDVGEHAWLSLDSTFSGAHMSYSERVRLGWRLLPGMSVGLEGGVHGYALSDAGLRPEGHDDVRIRPGMKAGAFARYQWASGEVSVAAGVMGEAWRLNDDLDVSNGYVAVNLLTKY